MRGMIGGLLAGGLVSALGLGTLSVLSEQPAGRTPPAAPLVDAPEAADAEPPATQAPQAPSSPVGAVTIDAPQTPDLPEGEEGAALDPAATEGTAPRADTDPLAEPEVTAIEGAMAAPDAEGPADVTAELEAPVLPNPLAQAPQTPDPEADLTISTAPAQRIVVIEEDDAADSVDAPDAVQTETVPELEPEAAPDIAMAPDVAPEAVEPDAEATPTPEPQEPPDSDQFVVDLGTSPAAPGSFRATPDDDAAIATVAPDEGVMPQVGTGPRVQFQGEGNVFSMDRDTGVTVRRPGQDAQAEGAAEEAASDTPADAAPADALRRYAADAPDVGDRALLSIVLIDDGSMSAAAAALAGLPFPVTIALDPAMADAGAVMQRYRAAGFEVAAIAKLPDGAQPSDVEVAFQSVLGTLDEAVAVLDIGNSGLQSDRAVTAQAMDILSDQGRGFVSAGGGLNTAGRAADAAGVPSAEIYRDLDADDQDARVIRRFVDQAAFRARQTADEGGIVLVGRVRPDTISALILWGTANTDDQVALVPLSAVLLAGE